VPALLALDLREELVFSPLLVEVGDRSLVDVELLAQAVIGDRLLHPHEVPLSGRRAAIRHADHEVGRDRGIALVGLLRLERDECSE
jgi:hypothetical protein